MAKYEKGDKVQVAINGKRHAATVQARGPSRVWVRIDASSALVAALPASVQRVEGDHGQDSTQRNKGRNDMNALATARTLTTAIRARTGTTVGIAVKQGAFAVTETTRERGRFHTAQLTGWQTHAECLAYMQRMAR